MFQQEKKKRRMKPLSWKNSEGAFKLKSSVGKEKRQGLTGYDCNRNNKEHIKEALRLESSYGNIAFGEDKQHRFTILISEKRRHNSPCITQREKMLHESRKIERPMGRGKILCNIGSKKEGAFAFQYQKGVSRFEMMERMRQYLSTHEQKTLEEMMPFVITKEDRKQKHDLEMDLRSIKEQQSRKQKIEQPEKELERANMEKEHELEQKRQAENRFSLKLVQALKEVKKEEKNEFFRTPFRQSLMKTLLDALEELPDETEDSKSKIHK